MTKQSCPGCRKLQRRVAELEALVRDLQARLGLNATNSSLPPSSNPPAAPQPVVKEPSERPPGGQPGHPPHQHVRLPPERVQHVVRHVPPVCERCATLLPWEPGPNDPKPTWHQVAELPAVAAVVTEQQGHARTCPDCGHVTHAAIPAVLCAHGLGPRLTAVMAYLSGARHDRKRGVEEVVETVFGVPTSLGTVVHLEQEVSAALAPAHAEAAAAVQAAPVKHADETGGKQAGRLCWLWTAVSASAASFVIHTRRGAAGRTALLGETIPGIVCSDRWSAYERLRVYQRQWCWAHLLRDFQAMVDRGVPSRAIGAELLLFAEDVFHWWYQVRDGTLCRASLRTYINEQRPWLRELLARGRACGCAKTEAVCRSLEALEPALWTFTRIEGVEPTNHAAERALRPAVLWRRRSFGCPSEGGCRFVERMLTVVQTLRLQKRGVLDYLVEAITTHRQGSAAPKLLATG
jgi:transposase